MIKRIDIGGIERQLSVSNMADGSMYELRGMTHRGGNLRPQGGLVPAEITNIDKGDRLLYVHSYDGYRHFIVVSEDGELKYHEGHDRPEYIGRVGDVRHVASIGNMLIASTPEGLLSWLWKGKEYVPQEMSALPLLIFEKMEGGYDGHTETMTVKYEKNYDGATGKTIDDADVSKELSANYASFRGMIQGEAWANNAFVDAMLVRYALRMYDGSYVSVSPPLLINTKSSYVYKAGVELDDTYEGKDMRTYMEMYGGYGLGYRLYAKDIKTIDAYMCPYIDIFISAPILQDNLATERIKGYSISPGLAGSGDYTLTYDVPRKGIDIEEHYVYYRVESIDVGELQKEFAKEEAEGTEGGVILKDCELKVGSKMSYLRQLPVLENVVSTSQYACNSMLVYNNRLHIGDVTEMLDNRYCLSHYYYNVPDEGGYGTRSEHVVVAYYDIGGVEYRKVSVYTNTAEGNTLNNLISIPDARVRRVVIACSSWKIDVYLKEHAMENMSYYYNEHGIPLTTIDEEEYASIKNTIDNNKIRREEVVKVSELNNPLVWPNDKTYTVGNSVVVAMAVATRAMSTGQFGEYPLYVFTSKGIYAMLSGGGDVLYSHVAPVNHHVVENAKSVCAIDDAVVFGTRQGMFVLSGGDAVCISGPLDEHGLFMRDLRQNIYNICGESIAGNYLRERIAHGAVAYHYGNKEILLYDKSGDCKIYSIENKKWYSLYQDVEYTVADYPDVYVVYNQGVYKIDDIPGDKSQILLVTNPMQLIDTTHYKRVSRIHVISHICSEEEDNELIVGICVSNDGEEYAVAWKKRMRVSRLHNMTIPHALSGYRYMVLVICGKELDCRSYINSIEVEYDEVRKER